MRQFTILSFLVAAAVLAGTGSAQVTEIVSVDTSGNQMNYDATLPPPGRFVSSDGRFVVIRTDASNLVPNDNNGRQDIFLRDRILRTTERVSVSSTGQEANGHSGGFGISLSADGRFVAFESTASNLVSGDSNAASDVFVHDRITGSTECVSLSSAGAQGNGASHYPSISADGRYVAFASQASNLVQGDTNAKWDIFLRDRLASTTEMMSISTTGMQGDFDSYKPEISADGRFIVFDSRSSTLVPGDTNGLYDVFIRDRFLGTTERVSLASDGSQGDGHASQADVSDDGRYVSFIYSGTNFAAGDTNATNDVYIRDRLTGTTSRVSVATDGTQANFSSGPAVISGDGQFVLFGSFASTLVPGDTNNASDVFIRDQRHSTTERISVTNTGSEPNASSGLPSFSPDARYVVFLSAASNLVPGDTNAYADMFIRDRFANGFTSLCDPGLNNVMACPCQNAPLSTHHGCDNSAFTGGASLSASGIAYLSIDSLVFTTDGETPSATSILLDGDALIPTGVVFGQGVRCAGGSLKRMYVKSALGGSITAPDVAGGDPTVSARSATLGSPIQPGQARYYLVYYRDPTVLGSCSPTSTFNSTQTGRVSWWP